MKYMARYLILKEKMNEKNFSKSAIFIYPKWIPVGYNLDKTDRSNYMIKSVLGIVNFDFIAAAVLICTACILLFALLFSAIIIPS